MLNFDAISKVYDYAGQGLPPELREVVSKAYLVHGERVIKEHHPDPGFLVEEMIPAVGVTTFVGEPGCGKSWVVYDLIRAVTTGTSWMGKSKPANGGEPRGVLLFDYDSQIHELQRRFKRLGMTGTEDLHVHTNEFVKHPLSMIRLSLGNEPEERVKSSNPLNDMTPMETVCALIQAVKPALVVFDSMRQAHTANESDNAEMGDLMAQFKAMCTPLPEHSCAVVLVHHTPKNSQMMDWQSKARGSGEIVAQSEAVIEVTTDKVIWTKARGWRMEPKTEMKYKRYDKDDRTYLAATGKVPGVDEKEEQLAHLVAIVKKEGSISLTDLKDKTGLTSMRTKELVERGKKVGIFRQERADWKSRKQIVTLTKKFLDKGNGVCLSPAP